MFTVVFSHLSWVHLSSWQLLLFVSWWWPAWRGQLWPAQSCPPDGASCSAPLISASLSPPWEKRYSNTLSFTRWKYPITQTDVRGHLSLKFNKIRWYIWVIEKHLPLSATQLSGSRHVYLSHLLALLRHTVWILNLYEPLHATPPPGLCAKHNITSVKASIKALVNKCHLWYTSVTSHPWDVFVSACSSLLHPHPSAAPCWAWDSSEFFQRRHSIDKKKTAFTRVQPLHHCWSEPELKTCVYCRVTGPGSECLSWLFMLATKAWC